MIDFTRNQIIVASAAAAVVVTVSLGIYFGIRANSDEAKEDRQRREDLTHRTHVNTRWADLKRKVDADKDLKKVDINKMAKELHAELAEYIAKAHFHSEVRREQLYRHNADKHADFS